MKAAGRSDVLIREVQDEAVVYDFESHKAHCLNRTALTIFRLANGARSNSAIAKAATVELGGEVTTRHVEMALEVLAEAELLASSDRDQARRQIRLRSDRRQWMKRVAGAAVAIPAVWSILAPTPAFAQSVQCIENNICTPGSHACCGTPGQPAMACNGMGMCNANASQCMGRICG